MKTDPKFKDRSLEEKGIQAEHQTEAMLGGRQTLEGSFYKPKPATYCQSHRKLGERHGPNSPSWPLDRTNLADTLNSDFQPPALQENKCLLFEATLFVTVC